MKNCAYIEKLLYPYLDGELDVGQNLIVEEHILNCQTCCDLLNEEKRFLNLMKNACVKKEGPPALKAKIERMLDKKQRPFFRIFSNHPFKMAFTAALAGLFIVLFSGNLLNLGSSTPPPFVRALVENHLKLIDENLSLEIESHDPQVVMAWFKKRIDYLPNLPVLEDDKVVLLGGRLAKFKGENMALISYRLEKSPVTMSIIKGNPTAFVESREFTFLHGRRFNFSRQHGFNTIAWTDDGNSFALISSLPSQNIVSCKVCHAQGSGLSDLNALLGI